jgi:RNA polymerase sigma-70 factor (ECF subfamily)
MGSNETSDAELLRQFHAGGMFALEELFERYERGLYQFLLGVLRDPHLAEDVLQDTFVSALQRLEGVDPDHLRGWLFTVAYHQAMLAKRKQKSRPAGSLQGYDEPDSLPRPDAQAELREEATRLRELLSQLPLGQQEVIRQRVYEGKRFREIAEALRCPLNTALARMHEGLKRLRLLWEQDHA